MHYPQDNQAEVDVRLETVPIQLPGLVITTDLRLNNPRYVTLHSIMKVKSKSSKIQNPQELGVSLVPRLTTPTTPITPTTPKTERPPERSAVVVVNDINKLLIY